ncbi:polysaccharide pyruvyl transferase family protein [Arthrobacter monumenti]
MHYASDGDVVWGTGVNGKALGKRISARRLDIRGVRGPLTRNHLIKRGFDVPPRYGDPGLLLGTLWPRRMLECNQLRRSVSVFPNFNDFRAWTGDPLVVDPTSPLQHCLRIIASSDLVVGSSLHAIVVAESLGIPARLVESQAEPTFKYRDYLLGTGRSGALIAPSNKDAIRMGGMDIPQLDIATVLDTFPEELWKPLPHLDSHG